MHCKADESHDPFVILADAQYLGLAVQIMDRQRALCGAARIFKRAGQLLNIPLYRAGATLLYNSSQIAKLVQTEVDRLLSYQQ